MATLDTLNVSLTNTRLVDGFVRAANDAGMTPEDLALEFLVAQGKKYSDGFRYGLVTSAEFVSRFTGPEYAAIIAAAEPVAIPAPVYQTPTAQEQADYDAAVATYEALEAPTPEEYDAYVAASDAYFAITSTVTNQAEIDTASVAAAIANGVATLIGQLTAEKQVSFDDPRVEPGLQQLCDLGLLTAERKTEILTYTRPEVA
jgi:hypothetical protein